jgi:2-keto-4-pentenoate hydratase
MSDADAIRDVTTAAEATATAFVRARRAAVALTAYPGDVPQTLQTAYRIQDAAILLRGGIISGWKVGRIQPPHDLLFGTTRLAGPIFADLVHPAAPVREMSVFPEGFGAIEAEFLFRLGTIPPGRTEWTIQDALACVTDVHVGFEVASSPYPYINRDGPVVTASDFGNNNGLLIGPAIPGWQDAGIDGMTVSTHIDGTLVGSGRAASFPGGCGGSIAFLLGHLSQRGIIVAPGTWVSTGAVTGVHEIKPGCVAVADFGGKFRIECRIVAATADHN